MKIPDVEDIVMEYLIKNGYDGLCNSELECACGVDNLAECGDMQGDCVVAHTEYDFLLIPGKRE